MTNLSIADSNLTEATVRLAASGDETAFARLVSEHHAAMTRVAYVITGTPDGASEAVQSAWSIAWRRLPSLRDGRSVRAWLVAIAANEARQSLRRERSRVVLDLSAVIDRSAATDADPADQIATLDLARVLRSLGPDDRSLLALRFVAGLDSTQIALQLGGSPSGVRTRLSRLIERLRKELDRG